MKFFNNSALNSNKIHVLFASFMKLILVIYLSLSTAAFSGISEFICVEETSSCCCAAESGMPFVPDSGSCCCEVTEVPPLDAYKFQQSSTIENLTCTLVLTVQQFSGAHLSDHRPFVNNLITTRHCDICIFNSILRI